MINLGKIFIFSAPSGAGKTTIVKHLLDKFPTLSFSVSATTRKMRAGETEGKDYYFLSSEAFGEQQKAGNFVEYAQVYDGIFYGTLKAEVMRIRKAKKHLLFDVDVQGGMRLKEFYQDEALAVFVRPPSLDVLEKRLKNRQTENPESLKKRLEKADQEMRLAPHFDKILLNDRLENTLTEAERIIQNFLET